jgi:hypothetical protein
VRELKKQQVWTLAQKDGTVATGRRFLKLRQKPIKGGRPGHRANRGRQYIDLIVLSTSARSGRPHRVRFGHEEIFRKATCPVFVLGPKVRAASGH